MYMAVHGKETVKASTKPNRTKRQVLKHPTPPRRSDNQLRDDKYKKCF